MKVSASIFSMNRVENIVSLFRILFETLSKLNKKFAFFCFNCFVQLLLFLVGNKRILSSLFLQFLQRKKWNLQKS
jgi:hypothetical protein